MIGLGLGILWIGYTMFAVGRVNSKGFQIGFSDMVLPSKRGNTLGTIKAAQGGLNQSLLGQGTLNYLNQPGTKPAA